MAKIEWLPTQAAIAKRHGVAPRTVANWVIVPDFPRKSAKGWRAIAVDEWVVARHQDREAESGPDSEALEELRRWKAKREKLAYERDLDQWIPRADVHTALAAFAGVIRQAADNLQRQFGPAARDMLEEAVTDGLHGLGRDLRTDAGGDSLVGPATNPASVADDA